MYNFIKTRESGNQECFSHEYFIRGRKDLLIQIVKKKKTEQLLAKWKNEATYFGMQTNNFEMSQGINELSQINVNNQPRNGTELLMIEHQYQNRDDQDENNCSSMALVPYKRPRLDDNQKL